MSSSRRILCLNTGGTISSVDTVQGPAPVRGSLSSVMQHHPSYQAKDAETSSQKLSELDIIGGTFDCRFLHKDNGQKSEIYLYEWTDFLESPGVNLSHWKAMERTVREFHAAFEGIIILHGTDTMAYSSSMLSYLLADLDVSVILTGSQIPLSMPDSDGWGNMADAIHFTGLGIKGVNVAFAGRLHLGTRVSKIDNLSLDAFDSPNSEPIAYRSPHDRTPLTLSTVPSPCLTPFPVYVDKSKAAVSIVFVHPGLIAREIDVIAAGFEDPYQSGVLLLAFGCGNLNTDTHGPLPAIQRAMDKGVWVVLGSQCVRGNIRAVYPLGRRLKSLGIEPTGDMTVEAAYTKMLWILLQKAHVDASQSDDTQQRMAWRKSLFNTVVASDRSSA